MLELNSCTEEPMSFATRVSKIIKITITRVIDKMLGRPFLLKKLYIGDKIIDKKRDKRKGIIIDDALFIPARTMTTLAITMK